MRLKKMGAGFYFEPDSGDRYSEMQRIAESGQQVDLVPVNLPGILATQLPVSGATLRRAGEA